MSRSLPPVCYYLVLFLVAAWTPTVRATVGLPSYARGGLLAAVKLEAAAGEKNAGDGCVEHNITVALNWDAPDDGRTMTVRYWVDASCVNGSSDSPIFLQMGGEGAASCWGCRDVGYWSGGGYFKATTVSVEHRFYGRSIPDSGLTAQNLPFLTTPQNLADTAAVIKAVNPGGARRVLNFGGSYSGGTAAWFRTQYPHLTHAAVSSSGVVNAILDYVQFDESIVSTLDDYSKREFPDCLSTVVAAIDALDAMSEEELRAAKTSPFNASVEQTDVDFMYMVADAIAMSVQYGGKRHLCSLLENITTSSRNGTTTPIEAVAAVIPILYGPEFQQGCFYNTRCIASTLRDSPTGVGNKAWRWQKCSLLGYIQSRPKDSKVAARSRLLTLESQRRQCASMFPGNEKDLENLVAANAKFQKTYGGATPTTAGASKIVFVDYSDDPWQMASVRGPGKAWPGRDLHYCFEKCDGCGHCGDGVPKNVTKCNNMIVERVQEWLSEK